MSAFANSVSSVLIILLLTAAGYILGIVKWMKEEHKVFLEKFLTNLALPCVCIDGLIGSLTTEILRSSWKVIVVAFAGICVTSALSAIIAFLLRLPRNRIAVFIGMAGFSNGLFVGYPMCRELFGDEATVYVILFFVSCSFMIYVGCNTMLAWFSERESNFSLIKIVKIVFNPPVVSIAAAVLIVILGISLPRPIAGFISYIGATVSPLALIYCGFVIFEVGLKNIRIDRGMSVMLVIRFLVSPLIGVALCRLFNVEELASSVLIVEMAMPVITILVVMSRQWDADSHYAAVGTVLSTLACFIVIPVLMLFF